MLKSGCRLSKTSMGYPHVINLYFDFYFFSLIMDVFCNMENNDTCILSVYRNECKYQKVLVRQMFTSGYIKFDQIQSIVRCQKIAKNISTFYTVKYDGICDKMILNIIVVSQKTLWDSKSLQTICFYLTKSNEYTDLLRQVNQLKVSVERCEKAKIKFGKNLVPSFWFRQHRRDYQHPTEQEQPAAKKTLYKIPDTLKRENK